MSNYLQSVARNKISEAERSRRAGLLTESEFQQAMEQIRQEYHSNLALWQRINAMQLENSLRCQTNRTEEAASVDPVRVVSAAPQVGSTKANLNLSDAMAQLYALTGLSAVKEQIQDLVAFAQIQKARERFGVTSPTLSKHLVFTGNPGTGKTTVARIIGQIYHALGLLNTATVIEVDRSGLVGGYVGQTAIKTSEIIKRAIGGTLFIDEAYTLSTGGEQDFGREAIDTLLKVMEDRRDDLLVIAAGYTDEMDVFLNANPGLRSRFSTRIHFDDYSVDQLMKIWSSQIDSFEYDTTARSQNVLQVQLEGYLSRKEPNFANARFIRNVFEKTVKAHARRVSRLAAVDRTLLCTIEAEDIETAFKQM